MQIKIIKQIECPLYQRKQSESVVWPFTPEKCEKCKYCIKINPEYIDCSYPNFEVT